MIDMLGKRFGRLVVIDSSTRRGSDGSAFWVCQCDCGQIKEILGTNLRKGMTQSCGCLQKEKAQTQISANRKSTKKPLEGMRFGKLQVITDSGQRTSQRRIVYKCQCDCGKVCYVSSVCLLTGDTLSCGCLRQSQGEYHIEQYLLAHEVTYQKEYTNHMLKTEKGGYLRFDFAIIKEGQIIGLIEFDGKQHLEATDTYRFNQEYLTQIQFHDTLKNEYCSKNRIPLLRINYKEKNNIQQCLDNFLQCIQS